MWVAGAGSPSVKSSKMAVDPPRSPSPAATSRTIPESFDVNTTMALAEAGSTRQPCQSIPKEKVWKNDVMVQSENLGHGIMTMLSLAGCEQGWAMASRESQEMTKAKGGDHTEELHGHQRASPKGLFALSLGVPWRSSSCIVAAPIEQN
ncbi:unnamed protein product, partial [Linum tenue]